MRLRGRCVGFCFEHFLQVLGVLLPEALHSLRCGILFDIVKMKTIQRFHADESIHLAKPKHHAIIYSSLIENSPGRKKAASGALGCPAVSTRSMCSSNLCGSPNHQNPPVNQVKIPDTAEVSRQVWSPGLQGTTTYTRNLQNFFKFLRLRNRKIARN